MHNKKHYFNAVHSRALNYKKYFKHCSPQQQKKIIIFGLLIFSILLIGCLTIKSHKPKTQSDPLLIRNGTIIKIPNNSPLRAHLLVRTVTLTNMPHIVVLPGVVEADQSRTITLFPPTTGYLTRLDIRLGEEVKKGQIVAEMQSSNLAQASADKVKAQSTLQQVLEALQRAQKVNRAGANSVKDLEVLQNSYNQARADLERAQTALAVLGTNNGQQLQIQAPIDGKIIALNYGAGSYINDATQGLFTLSNIDNVWVSACIPEHLIAQIAKGQKVEVTLTAYPKKIWKGNIAFLDNVIEPSARCNKSRIAFANKEKRLQPNMFAAIKTQIPQEEQIMIPLSAILMNDDSTSVYLETAPWVFTQRKVTLGTEDGDNVRITTGLKAGDRVVMAGGILIND